jgi:dipeptidyl aminopeptidase/acylaminoacyl peptidase
LGCKALFDVQKGWKHVLDKYPEIDRDRVVAAGANWGGYAIK